MEYIIKHEDLLPSINSTEIIQHEQISTGLSGKPLLYNSAINKSEQDDVGNVDAYGDTLHNKESVDASTIKQENSSSDEHYDVTDTVSDPGSVSKEMFLVVNAKVKCSEIRVNSSNSFTTIC